MRSWERASGVLRETIGDRDFETWIKPLRVTQTGEAQVVVFAPSKFYRDWVARHFLDAVRDAFRDRDEVVPDVSIQVERGLQRELFSPPVACVEVATPAPAPSTRRPPTRVGNLVPRYTFANFVIGTSNEFAHAAARAVATRPGEKYNPLFIYGGVGVGKTHLVNAIGHSVLEKNPFARVVYTPSEGFVNDMIAALRRDRMDEFKSRFRKVDLLIIDDVQFLAGRGRTQEEFFHTFNSLHEGHRQIVLTSDKYPKDIPDLEERLRNRFEWGLTADIQAPELETRAAIVQKKAEMAGLRLPADVASFIATEFTANARELEGALTCLAAKASLLHSTEMTLAFATSVLNGQQRARTVSMEDIQRAVCEQFGVTMGDMKSKRRTQRIAFARQLAMYLSRRHLPLSYPQIGEKFGGRDHSTVIHAQGVVERRLKTDAALGPALERIERALTRSR
jgi:chromosomal replication initiator protein